MLFYFFEPIAQFIDVETGYFGYILIPDFERERFLFESQAMAFRTFDGRDKLVGPFLARRTLVILHHLLQVVDDAIVGAEVVGRGMHLFLFYLHVFERTIKNFLHGIARNLTDRCLQVEVILAEQ